MQLNQANLWVADAVVIADEQGGTLTFVPMNEALPKRPGWLYRAGGGRE